MRRVLFLVNAVLVIANIFWGIMAIVRGDITSVFISAAIAVICGGLAALILVGAP